MTVEIDLAGDHLVSEGLDLGPHAPGEVIDLFSKPGPCLDHQQGGYECRGDLWWGGCLCRGHNSRQGKSDKIAPIILLEQQAGPGPAEFDRHDLGPVLVGAVFLLNPEARAEHGGFLVGVGLTQSERRHGKINNGGCCRGECLPELHRRDRDILGN